MSYTFWIDLHLVNNSFTEFKEKHFGIGINKGEKYIKIQYLFCLAVCHMSKRNTLSVFWDLCKAAVKPVSGKIIALNKRITKTRRNCRWNNWIKTISLKTHHVDGFHVETTWKRLFPRRFNVESTWCICWDIFGYGELIRKIRKTLVNTICWL